MLDFRGPSEIIYSMCLTGIVTIAHYYYFLAHISDDIAVWIYVCMFVLPYLKIPDQLNKSDRKKQKQKKTYYINALQIFEAQSTSVKCYE